MMGRSLGKLRRKALSRKGSYIFKGTLTLGDKIRER
jgi:hypothetical protein